MKKLIKGAISSLAIITTLAYMTPVYAIENQETIYSKLNSEGKSYKTIVTTKNEGKTNQEETEKELPLEAKITYSLDGKEITPEELVGKSGKVSIKIEYINKSSKKVTIGGKVQTLYTPFIVAVGTIIDNNKNTNIEVSKGAKIIENGGKSIVVGMILPGLEESLGIDEIDIPSNLEITMDAKEFEMKNIMTYASPKVLTEDIDWNKFDGLFDKVNELKQGADKLEEGAKTLNTGINTLKDGTLSLNDGASKIEVGANTLQAGINTLQTGTENLNKGAKTLSKGASDLSHGATSVNNGAKSLNTGIKDLEKGLQNAGTGIASLQNGSSQLATGASSVDKGANDLKIGLETLNQKTTALETGADQITEGVSNIAKNLSKIGTQVKGLEEELANYAKKTEELKKLKTLDEKYRDNAEDETEKAIWQKNIDVIDAELQLLTKSSGISKLVNGIEEISEGANKLEAKISELPKLTKELNAGVGMLSKGATELKAGTKQLSEGANSLNTGTTALANGTSELTKGAAKLSKGSESLVVGTKSLETGASSLNNGAAEIAKGTNSVATGVNSLAQGSKSLTAGTKKLSTGTSSLVGGVDKLSKGSLELANGIHKFNSEGISKIYSLVNGDFKNFEQRAKKLEELSKEYNRFNSEEKREEIGFISIVDSIKKKEDNK